MGLTYHFKFRAAENKTAEQLEAFLKELEREAQSLGFNPTMVLNVRFDSTERRAFSRRLTSGVHFQHENLKGVVLLYEGQVWTHDPMRGDCRVIPERRVVLVITDELGNEAVLGFFQYPTTLKDANGRDVLRTGIGQDWIFEDCAKSSDPRLRLLVRRFAESGYLVTEVDDFTAK